MWVWNSRKNAANQYLHRTSFQEAQEVFDDPLSATRLDRNTASMSNATIRSD